jgi:UDP-N-acetylmuramoyl-L-alanyl-D-glutamate--2,6-diaminopimelate ligase
MLPSEGVALHTLLPDCPEALADLRVTGIESDTRRLQPGMLYVGLRTRHGDGHAFAQAAWNAGAVAVLVEGTEGVTELGGRPLWSHPAARELLGMALRRWYRWDEEAAPLLVGVTGTNGKSSVTRLIAQLAPQPGMVLGTLGYGCPDALTPLANTTPEAVTLWRALAEMRGAGARVIAVEVSSHALDLGRVAEVPFAAAVFTNLSRDHLDFHGDMERYFAAKAALFRQEGLRLAVLNGDDPMAERLARMLPATVRVLRYGLGAGDYHCTEFHPGASGTLLKLHTPAGERVLRSPLLGSANAMNLLAALAVVEGLGWPAEAAAVAAVSLPEGRYQRLAGGPGQPQVMVDYAHSPDALARVLTDLRRVAKGRITVIFGCGGDRDVGKRPEMGRIAEMLADRIVLTDDNPRSEDPAQIVTDILAGMQRPAGVAVIHDRAEAIRRGILEAGQGDWVLIAGKGHESYQERGGQRRPFADIGIAREVLEP